MYETEEPERLMMSMRRLPFLGSNVNALLSGTTMSKFFGPPAGPLKALDIGSAPLNPTIPSGPTLSSKARLSASGCEELVERLIWIFEMVVENANPTAALGR